MKAFLKTLERSDRFEHENDLRWRVCVWRSKCGRLKIEYCPYNMHRWRLTTVTNVWNTIGNIKALESALVKFDDPVYAEWLNGN